MGEGGVSVGFAIRRFVEAHRVLASHGISLVVGDYGEKIAQMTIGGDLMPPTFKGYDLRHTEYGRVQIKTRALLDRAEGALSEETRAVLNKNRSFDWLFHIVLDRDMVVRDAILAPVEGILMVADANSGKLSITQTRAVLGAINLSISTKNAQEELNLLQ